MPNYDEERVVEKLPSGDMIVRTTTEWTRYFHVTDKDGVIRQFEVAPGAFIERLYATTAITGFPDKSRPLTIWAAREASKNFAGLVRKRVPGIISNGLMGQAKPYTMMYMAARDWFMSGESAGDVKQKIVSFNGAFAKPLEPDTLFKMLSAAEAAAIATMEEFEQQVQMIQVDSDSAHKRMKDRAADLGTKVHKWVELDMKGVQQDIPDEIAKPISAYKRWRKTEGVAGIIALEKMIYHPSGFAGTVDAVLRLADGRIAIVDFKTSAGIYESHLLQIGAYAKAWEHVHGDDVDIGYAVRFGRDDGQMEPVQVVIDPAWNTFKTLIPGYHLHKTVNKDARYDKARPA